MKVGLFGGTFDPIHFGHMNLAIEAFEKLKLDKIYFCPAKQNPLKDTFPTASDHRLNMLKLAIKAIPQFEILDWELERSGPSYTVDTVEQLSSQFSNLYLLVGDDTVQSFQDWKDWKRIEEMATIVVGARCGGSNSKFPFRIMEISATEVRERIRNGLYCEHLVPKIVLDYIHTHQLYLNMNYER